MVTSASTITAVVRQSLNMLKLMEANIAEAIKRERNRLKFDYVG